MVCRENNPSFKEGRPAVRCLMSCSSHESCWWWIFCHFTLDAPGAHPWISSVKAAALCVSVIPLQLFVCWFFFFILSPEDSKALPSLSRAAKIPKSRNRMVKAAWGFFCGCSLCCTPGSSPCAQRPRGAFAPPGALHHKPRVTIPAAELATAREPKALGQF